MNYKISIGLTYTWEMFQGFFTKKFLDDFGNTILPVSWIVTKFTFIGILEDAITLHGKK